MKPRRIPAVVNLPFGYTIRIRQVSKTECEDRIGFNALAGWVSDERTVYLTKSRPIKQRRADLAHELQHVLVDYLTALIDQGLAKHE